MGNNPSTLTDKKTGKDRKMISRPMAMGSQRRSLGPDVVISNTILPEPNHRRHSRQNSRQSSLAHSRHASDETSPSPRQSDEVFRPTLRPGASEIRRARSANAPGPVRADRSEGLGAPPPYMTVYEPPTQPGFRLPVSPQSYASPPEDSHIANATNLRRAVTTSTTPGFALPNRAMSPAFDSFSDEMYSGYDRKLLGSEDHGYGVGDGSNTSPIRSPSHSPSDRPLPPVPGSLRFPEPQMDFVPSPVESHTFHNDVEDPLELLKRYNTIFLIDDSLSMRGEKWAEVGDRPHSALVTLLNTIIYSQAREALARLADLAAGYDLDGIDAQFLNNNKTVKNMRVSLSFFCKPIYETKFLSQIFLKSASAVKMEFDRTQPQGISLLGMKLEELLRDYISILESDTSVARLSIKPVNYIIITDGGSSMLTS